MGKTLVIKTGQTHGKSIDIGKATYVLLDARQIKVLEKAKLGKSDIRG